MKKFFIPLTSFIYLTAAALPAIAADEVSEGIKLRSIKGSGCLYKSVVTIDCIPIIVFNVIYWLIFFSGVVALFLIIFGGFRFMTSGGDPKNVEGARKVITWAIIGLIVILFAFAIVTFISDVTGVRCLTSFGFVACK